MHSGWGEDEGSLQTEVNELGQPIGNSSTKLASNLGVLARNGILLPLTYRDWRHMDEEFKNDAWAHVKV